MNAFAALAWNGFREAYRNKVTVVVAAFAAVLLLSTSLVAEVTVSTFSRVLSDFGLGSMSLILVFLAVFLSSGLLGREIERRTIFLMVSRPVSRGAFLVARLCGTLLTLAILELVMFAVFAVQLSIYDVPVNGTHILAAIALWGELAVLCAAGFFFSSFASQMTSAVVVSGLYMAGHLSETIYSVAQRSEHALIKIVGTAAYYVVPQLERLDFRPYAAYGKVVSASEFWWAMTYATGYSSMLCVLAVLAFSRRDFR
jgi:ABC-type transport system involved in multi-copper enzyme maturation permease subunit